MTIRIKRPRFGFAVLAAAGALVGLALTAPAQADVIFTLGNHPQSGEENILFNNCPSTPCATGGTLTSATVDHTGIEVDFMSLTGQILYQKAQGQADIMNAADPGTALVTSIDIKVPGYTFGDFIMNPLNGDGNAHVVAIDNFNNVFNYDLGNGQNYLTITTAAGESISELQITVTCLPGDTQCINSGPGFIEFKQPRISEVCPVSGGLCVASVPEPASLAILGAALVGLGLIRRRRKAV